jgi:hypothetical protein
MQYKSKATDGSSEKVVGRSFKIKMFQFKKLCSVVRFPKCPENTFLFIGKKLFVTN